MAKPAVYLRHCFVCVACAIVVGGRAVQWVLLFAVLTSDALSYPVLSWATRRRTSPSTYSVASSTTQPLCWKAAGESFTAARLHRVFVLMVIAFDVIDPLAQLQLSPAPRGL